MRFFNRVPLTTFVFAISTCLTALPAQAIPIDLGGAASFAVLGASMVTNTGPTVINGNVGVSPGTAITGFGVMGGTVMGGGLHSNDALATQAAADLVTAFNQGNALPVDTDLTGQGLGGLTLTPGVYFFSSSAQLDGTLTLDKQGDPNAQFVFQVGTTLTTGTGAAVSVIIDGGGTPGQFGSQVDWIVGSSATLGTGTSFQGSILAFSAITLTNGASIGSGRALAQGEAVTLDTNAVSLPTDVAAGAPELDPNSTVAPLALMALFLLFSTDRRIPLEPSAAG